MIFEDIKGEEEFIKKVKEQFPTLNESACRRWIKDFKRVVLTDRRLKVIGSVKADIEQMHQDGVFVSESAYELEEIIILLLKRLGSMETETLGIR